MTHIHKASEQQQRHQKTKTSQKELKNMDQKIQDISPSNGCSNNIGEPIQIIKIKDENEEGEHRFFLDDEALNNIMDDERIRDKPLCIVSVAGNLIIIPLLYFENLFLIFLITCPKIVL